MTESSTHARSQRHHITADDWPDTLGHTGVHVHVHIEGDQYVGQVVRADLTHPSIASLFEHPDLNPPLVARDECWADIEGAPKRSHTVRLGVISLTSEAFLNSSKEALEFDIKGNGLLSDYPDPDEEPSVIR